MQGLRIPFIDLFIIVAYLLGILAVGVLSVRRQRMTGEAYFLAGRSLGWIMIGAALFASNISTIHLVGLAASGYNEGLVWGNFEWMAAFTLVCCRFSSRRSISATGSRRCLSIWSAASTRRRVPSWPSWQSSAPCSFTSG